MSETSWPAVASVVVAAIALAINAHAVYRNNRKIELDLFDRIHTKLTDLERRLSSFDREHTSEDMLAHWRGDLLNGLEYAAFLFNNEYIGDKRLLAFWEDSVAEWYERFYLAYASEPDRSNPERPYKELKKLYTNRVPISEPHPHSEHRNHTSDGQ